MLNCIVRKTLYGEPAGTVVNDRLINNMRFAGDTTLPADNVSDL